MRELSNRAYAQIVAALVGSIVTLFLLIQNAAQIQAALRYVLYALAGLACLALLYVCLLAWHQIHTRHLQRRAISEEIRRENARLEHEKERARQEAEAARDLEYARLDLERERLALEREKILLEASRIVVPGGHRLVVNDAVNGYLQFDAPAQLAARAGQGQEQEDAAREGSEERIPRAPAFPDMQHLISSSRMPLCFIRDAGGQTIPAYGTVDDLLSMAVTGKPGRGKTTALMYYVAILLRSGAEVYVYDPHGVMGELAALNNRRLPGMPVTARIVYVDRREDMVSLVPALLSELDARDELYRASRTVKHPLLLLADELPVLAEYDDATAQEYKLLNKQRARAGQLPIDAPLMIDLIKRIVLEARKWRCFFIGSGQSFDAEILPTRVTENLNSRIVFFSSDRRARMSGLENDTVKELLPIIRNAGPGVMIFDCSRWERPAIGAIPAITVEDLYRFVGLQGAGAASIPPAEDLPAIETTLHSRDTEPMESDAAPAPVEPFPARPGNVLPASQNERPGTVTGLLGPNDKRLSTDLARQFQTQYRQALRLHGHADIKAILRSMRIGNSYYKHASILADQIKSEKSEVR